MGLLLIGGAQGYPTMAELTVLYSRARHVFTRVDTSSRARAHISNPLWTWDSTRAKL
jgi:hypothetical protein